MNRLSRSLLNNSKIIGIGICACLVFTKGMLCIWRHDHLHCIVFDLTYNELQEIKSVEKMEIFWMFGWQILCTILYGMYFNASKLFFCCITSCFFFFFFSFFTIHYTFSSTTSNCIDWNKLKLTV